MANPLPPPRSSNTPRRETPTLVLACLVHERRRTCHREANIIIQLSEISRSRVVITHRPGFSRIRNIRWVEVLPSNHTTFIPGLGGQAIINSS